MHKLISSAITVLFLAGMALAAPGMAAEKEICLVCKVKEGATEPEKVVATRTYEQIQYGFCSEPCAKEFDSDPLAYIPASFPRPAPDLALTDMTQKPLSWESYQGSVVLVDFWATWCKPCKKSMPELQALHDKYKSRGFSVLGVSIDEGDPKKVEKFVSSQRITYPIAIDSNESPAWERFRVKTIPAAFLVDPAGKIVAQWTGVPPDIKEVEAKLAAILPSTPSQP